MAPRKNDRNHPTLSNRAMGPPASEGHTGIAASLDTDGASGHLGTEPPTSGGPFLQFLPTAPIPESQPAREITIKLESDSDEDTTTIPTIGGGNPDPFWIKEWSSLDLKSAIASQVDFFKTCPNFSNFDLRYVLFFEEIQKTILAAKKTTQIFTDETARANLKSLRVYFEDYEDKFRKLLGDDLHRIRFGDYNHCQSLEDWQNTWRHSRDFLDRTKLFAFYVTLGDEWTAISKFLKVLKKNLTFAEEAGSHNGLLSSLPDMQAPSSPLHMQGPLSLEMLEMNYKFTDDIWYQWADSVIAYFMSWTSDETRKLPAEDFVRHLSHYRLAMELFIRHDSLSAERRSTLLEVAKKYMLQYREYAATKLEKRYARLKEDVKSAGIYITEAQFWYLADDIEVLLNEPPLDITAEIWNDAVPALLPQDKVLAAKNAVRLLYKEFQIKRYPGDEVSYLWLLTWRNIKHTFPYLTSPIDRNDIRPEDDVLRITNEARDLAAPFVDEHLSLLHNIIRKDNDALYQKEIESLVAGYCAHIDSYVKGEGKGQIRIYEQFARLSDTKRVPFVYLVQLEESLLKQGAKPTNESQIVAHRVAKRLNHIMEGPKQFNRWEIAVTGDLKTYSPTSTWVNEQSSLKEAEGFNHDDVERPASSPSSYRPSQLPGAGDGAGGDDDGDDDKRNPVSEDNGESSGSDEEVEVVSAGGTKRKIKLKKMKKAKLSVDAETLTKAKLEQLVELSKRPDSNSRSSRSSYQAENEDEKKEALIMSGLHVVPADSLNYHRRRLSALREEEVSAVPNAQYPLPETAAPQRAAALQIAREMADQGIFTDGPRPEDVQNYINPALRLPLAVYKTKTDEKENNAQPPFLRRTLQKLRATLGSPFFGSPPKRSPPRAVPHVPESDAQRARREREEQERTPTVLKPRADKYLVSKSPPRERSPRRFKSHVSSFGPASNASGSDVNPPGGQKNQGGSGAGSSGSSHRSIHAAEEGQTSSTSSSTNNSNQENQTPLASSSVYGSNQENQSPAKGSNQENQGVASSAQRVQANVNDWNTPSPPHQYDNNIYRGSPQRTPSTPTPVKREGPRKTNDSGLPALPPAGGQAAPVIPSGDNLNASPAGSPVDDGPNPQLRELNRWVAMGIASNNRDMRAAYLLHRELLRQQSADTLTYLFEMLRAGVEMATFHNYVFERDVVFGPEARPEVRRGVPITVHAPSTPRAQIDPASEWWWNDPLEGTREGVRRPGVAWAEAPSEAGEAAVQSRVLASSSRHAGTTASSKGVPASIRDEHSNPTSREVIDDTHPSGEHTTTSPLPSWTGKTPASPVPSNNDPDRTWSWRSNSSTGLPEREFNIYIDPDARRSASPRGLGEPLLVRDPLNHYQLTPNPRFDPDILRWISAAGNEDHGQINVRVPEGWRISVGPSERRTRSAAPSPPGGSGGGASSQPRLGEQEVVFSSPGFVIHEDPPSGGSVRDGSNAPETLGLLDQLSLEEEDDVVETVETNESQSTSQTHATNQGTGSNSTSQAENASAKLKSSASGSGNGGKKNSNSNASNSTPHGNGPTTAAPPATNPPVANPPATTTETPWYLTWETSTVARLRDELLRRGISLGGLKLKQQMIDRLRRDDAENGVGGVYVPDGEDDEQEEQIEDEDEVDEETEPSGNAGDAGLDEGSGGEVEIAVVVPRPDPGTARGRGRGRAPARRALKRRIDPFMGDGAVIAKKRRGEDLK